MWTWEYKWKMPKKDGGTGITRQILKQLCLTDSKIPEEIGKESSGGKLRSPCYFWRGGRAGRTERKTGGKGERGQGTVKCGVCSTDVSTWQDCFTWKRKSTGAFLLLSRLLWGEGEDRECLVAASTNATHHPLAMPVQKSSRVSLLIRI